MKKIFIIFLVVIIFTFTGIQIKNHFISKDVTAENRKISYLDYLFDLSQIKENVKIVVIGSSVTKGSGSSNVENNWPTRLYVELKNEGIENLELVNLGFSGYKAEDLLARGKVSELFKEQPDFIIFETSVINNFRQAVTLEQTIKYIDILLNKVARELPESRVLVISPNPILTMGKNEAGLFYRDYIEHTERYISEKGYAYFSIYEEMNRFLHDTKNDLTDFLADEIHPNDEGYELWAEILFEHIKAGY